MTEIDSTLAARQAKLAQAIGSDRVVSFLYLGRRTHVLPVALGVHAGSALIAWTGYKILNGDLASDAPELFRLSSTHDLVIEDVGPPLPVGHKVDDLRLLVVLDAAPAPATP